MAAQLSPKQYIQARARSLPVYKCYVNKDWQSGGMAEVFVIRRHVNGNITAGVYLVDLFCLGIKDTMYIFNQPEASIEEQYGERFYAIHKEIDYDLAHNIVYAGHDYAMDYEIKPHADFAITRFILEEDDDAIPLIDVETGHGGMPHLMVAHAGQFSDALAKLKKHAGEGNYYYTIGDDLEAGEEEDYDDEDGHYDEAGSNETDDDSDYVRLDDIELGAITPFKAQEILNEDLFDEEKVEQRAPNEITTLQTEIAIRAFRQIAPDFFDFGDREEGPDVDILEDGPEASGVTEEQANEFLQAQQAIKVFYDAVPEDKDVEEGANIDFLMGLVTKYKDNPLVATNIFESAILSERPAMIEGIKEYLQKLSPQYPLATLSLAAEAQINKGDTAKYAFIYDSASLTGAFADRDDLGLFELAIFSLLQTLISLKDDDLKLALYYYLLAVDTNVFSWLLPVVQGALISGIEDKAKGILKDQGGNDDDNNAKGSTLRAV